jgi:hypothetical protein
MALVCLVNAALSVLVVAVVSPVALIALAPMSWWVHQSVNMYAKGHECTQQYCAAC